MSLLTVRNPTKMPITIHQGSSYMNDLKFDDIDLSLFMFRGQIRSEHASSEVLASFSFAVIPDEEGDPHVLHVYLTPAQTSAVPPGRVVYDIEAYTENDAFVQRLFEGPVKVTPEVTR
jgi:hypothetical protein